MAMSRRADIAGRRKISDVLMMADAYRQGERGYICEHEREGERERKRPRSFYSLCTSRHADGPALRRPAQLLIQVQVVLERRRGMATVSAFVAIVDLVRLRRWVDHGARQRGIVDWRSDAGEWSYCC
jgi:hypothetical protein